MAEFEPTRILENPQSGLETENMQQYVEIGTNTYLGTKDGIKYALIPTSDNKFKLCEVSTGSNMSLNNSKSIWENSLEEENKTNTNLTISSGYKAIKLIAVRKEPTPCKGQGDESGNSIILTPDSASQFKNVGNNIPEKVLEVVGGNQIQIEENPPLTYTTLVPKQERVENVTSVSYTIPQNTVFQVPPSQVTPVRPGRFLRGRSRMRLAAGSPYPACSPILRSGTRRPRGRRPRQVWYQYRAPILQSTPASISSSSYTSSGSSPLSLDVTRNSSISSCNESQGLLEYPRVPNNTPNSEEEGIEDKPKLLDLQQWIPQLHSRIEDYVAMDPRESHNEKERKRRLRIKNACQCMKDLLPCVCEKTDNATIFENAVHFITFMRETVGREYDMEFLEQTCVY